MESRWVRLAKKLPAVLNNRKPEGHFIMPKNSTRQIGRRAFMLYAAAMGATAAWARPMGGASRQRWTERRDRYPDGVASGDPDSSSVILWNRGPEQAGRPRAEWWVQIADEA